MIHCQSRYYSFILKSSALCLTALVLSIPLLKAETQEIRERGLRFTNPLLDCEGVYSQEPKILRSFERVLELFVNKKLTDKQASHISIYFRDLNNGPWFGINEREDFAPASLLKVPIMIAYFKQAETDPAILQKKILYEEQEDYNLMESVKPKEMLIKGESYTIDDLIYRMIIYSDNNATNLLYHDGLLNNLYKDFGLITPITEKPLSSISVKEYASFFRILFNATYLTKPMSEKALFYLSQVNFKRGIPAGVPSDIMIAHKFGERQGSNTNEKQLHDCGIIYMTERPYLLCVMTRGTDFELLTQTIRDISRFVYQELNQQLKKK